ncbi:hypothetical protein [Pseudomonas akapageensis]|uniref:hypothetical protein n=1 Tax=Pseudomonas akapageensis TaxID=2609961 RepID=UPI00140758A6|nr:hypothetical protein [Pseudomonas akapageensis]
MKENTGFACVDLALERNKQLIEEARKLRSAAAALLENPHADAETFALYLRMKQKADRKTEEAIKHRKLINREEQDLTALIADH